MNVRYVVNRIRRKFHSRMKLQEVFRKVYWLEFENESILNALTKYNIIKRRQHPSVKSGPKIQDFVEIESEHGFEINVLEYSNN